MRVADREPSPDCASRESCSCMDLFDAFYSVYILVIFAFTACKVKLSCSAAKISITRREIKLRSRGMDMIFSCGFFLLTALLLFAFLRDTWRAECQKDTRYEKMNQVAGVVMFLAIVQSLILFTRSIFICQAHCQARRRKRMDPHELSSDEEDNDEFLRSVTARNRRIREQRENSEGERGAEAGINNRDHLVNQIRSMISQNSRRRNILSQLGDIERRLYEATQKSRQLSLKRYVQSLKEHRYKDYEMKDPEMPNCTICLITFAPEDNVIAFSCDPKHYFHSKCG
mmetsp:Transcript_28570/g.35347  ORF Transcript_28570/g.35347 Transcript_28570/m.35347 type:complete len:285 (+) Transcript_28570:441-1295(+)